MTILDGRIGRFVKAARSLLLVQAAVALLALGLSVWAFIAVRELAAERERLQGRVAELEGQRGAASPGAASAGPEALPPDPNTAPPATTIIIGVPIPITGADPIAPVDPAPVADPPKQEPGVAQPPAEPDCSGANANQARCRPGRWNRRDPALVRPVPPVTAQPQPQQPKLP